MTVFYVLAAAASGIGALVGLLRLGKVAGDRLVAGGRDEPAPPPPVVPEQGWLYDGEREEQARQQALADQLDAANRQFAHDLDALTRVIGQSLDAIVEQALAALHLDPADSWVRLATGEQPLVGVA